MTQPEASQADAFARTALNSWKLSLDRLNRMLDDFSDDELQQEIAPGKNRIYYLLGHLVAVHDRMFPLLGLGERLHEELDPPFVTNRDRTTPDPIPAPALRQLWAKVNGTLTRAMEALPTEAWLQKHAAVSAEDFAREPLRNRLAVLLSRTAHVQFHTGQIRLVSRQR